MLRKQSSYILETTGWDTKLVQSNNNRIFFYPTHSKVCRKVNNVYILVLFIVHPLKKINFGMYSIRPKLMRNPLAIK